MMKSLAAGLAAIALCLAGGFPAFAQLNAITGSGLDLTHRIGSSWRPPPRSSTCFAIEDLLEPVSGDERVLEIDNDAGPRQKARLAGDARSDSGAFANGNMIR